MMNFKNPEMLSLLRFLSKHMPAIEQEYLKHKTEQGYILIKADENFQQAETLRFISRGFNKNKFISITEFRVGEQPDPGDPNWLFLEIQKGQNEAAWYLKKYNAEYIH